MPKQECLHSPMTIFAHFAQKKQPHRHHVLRPNHYKERHIQTIKAMAGTSKKGAYWSICDNNSRCEQAPQATTCNKCLATNHLLSIQCPFPIQIGALPPAFNLLSCPLHWHLQTALSQNTHKEGNTNPHSASYDWVHHFSKTPHIAPPAHWKVTVVNSFTPHFSLHRVQYPEVAVVNSLQHIYQTFNSGSDKVASGKYPEKASGKAAHCQYDLLASQQPL